MKTRTRWLLGGTFLLALCALGGAGLLAYAAWGEYQKVEPGLGKILLAREFPVPSRLYARPLVLTPGMSPERAGASMLLEAAGYRPVEAGEPVVGEYSASDERWAIGRRRFLHADGWSEEGLFSLDLDGRGRITAIRGPAGEEVASLRIDPPVIGFFHGKSPQLRESVPLEELPPALVDAFLAIEDQRFFEHIGVDPPRIFGAALANARAGRIVQGGSTITQQLARNVFLTRERVITRKVREAAIAVHLEEELTKEEILGAYFDEIYLGQRGPVAIHGVGAASRHFFGQDVRDLQVHQAALLAALVRGPSRYSPLRDAEAARERRDLVLRRMAEVGRLDAAERDAALARGLDLRPAAPRVRSAEFFVEQVRAALAPEYEADVLEGDGLRIFTTLDWRLQHLGEVAVRDGLEELEGRARKLLGRDPPIEGALLVLDPNGGGILAMIGGRDYGRSQFNRTTQAKRQPGSAFKTVVALAALDPPNPTFTLASTVADDAILVPAPEPEPGEEQEEDWMPMNHDEEFRGDVTLREALEDSLNIPMVLIAQQVGLQRVIETARGLGIRGRLNPVPSLALGTFEVSLLSMTRAYGVLAAGGMRASTRSWTAVTDAEGEVLGSQRRVRKRAFGAEEAFLVTSALEGAVDRGTGKQVRHLGYRGPLAGKTGSSDDYRDGWFIGYTPELTLGVWVGFDDEGSTGLPGSRTALPVFTRFLKSALGRRGGARFHAPPGVTRGTVSARVGIDESSACREIEDWFITGTEPRSSCGSFWNPLPAVGADKEKGIWPWNQ